MALKGGIGIVGAGPAGISAAVQLSRCDLPVTLFEMGQAGGLVRNAWRVDNLPVLPMMPGPRLADTLAQRLMQSRATLVEEKVLRADFDPVGDLFSLQTRTSVYRVHTLVLATGTHAKDWSLLEGMDARLLPFVHREIVGLPADGRVWAVVGSGDAAFDYALSLSDNGGRVVLLQRGRRAKALPLLQREVASRGQAIDHLVAAQLSSLKSGGVRPLHLEISQSGRRLDLKADGLVVAIGRKPADDCLSQDLPQRADILKASKRFFCIGDVKGSHMRQVAIAMGDGLRAAMEIAETYRDQKE